MVLVDLGVVYYIYIGRFALKADPMHARVV
jgi:hypothetical protein